MYNTPFFAIELGSQDVEYGPLIIQIQVWFNGSVSPFHSFMLLVSFLKLIETIRQILPAVSCFNNFQSFPLIIILMKKTATISLLTLNGELD